MKKFFMLLLGLISCLCLLGCDKENGDANLVERGAREFTELGKNQTLVVGRNKYINTTDTTVEEKVLEYVSEQKYVLKRQSSNYSLPSNDYVMYLGAYYYWTVDSVIEEEILGDETTTKTITYSYIEFAEKDENILVKKTVETSKTYSYASAYITKPIKLEFELNGYFDSLSHLEEECPDLLKGINMNSTKKYYVDASSPTIKTFEYSQYTDTYYYFA